MPKLELLLDVEEQIADILAPLLHAKEWADLKLSFAPSPSAIIRMEGKPGTGKTALAEYIARKLRKKPLHFVFGNVASASYGETESKIIATFTAANETETPVIIMEECDSMLWSRDLVNEDTTTMLGIINTFLTEIDKFINRPFPSLLILTTNHPKLLDEAFESRISDVIRLSSPVGKHAERMWRSKLPTCINTTPFQMQSLVSTGATPRQMENAIRKICRRAMRFNRQPLFEDFGI